jgi:DNA-binding NarL/FixJ family response regulator
MLENCIRVAVIDDHRIFAEALAGRLCDEPDLEVVGTAGSSAEALELFLHNEVQVMTLDLDLAGEDGLALGRLLADGHPQLAIVVVTASVADDRVCEAVQMGVKGWVTKQGDIENLLVAVRGAACGETHMPPALLVRALVSSAEQSGASPPDSKSISLLTARELVVLRHLMNGLSRTEIAVMLWPCPRFVDTGYAAF